MNFSIFFENNFKIIFPELFILISICFLLIYGVVYSSINQVNILNFIGTINNYKKKTPILLNNIVFLTIYSLIITLFLINNNPIIVMVGYNDTFIYNEFTNLIKISVIISTLCLFVLLGGHYKTNKYFYYEYVILLLLALLGIIGIISNNYLITMYLAIETQSLALHV